MNLTDLRVFASAARQPSLAAAAAELHLTPSAVSKALRQAGREPGDGAVRPFGQAAGAQRQRAPPARARAPCWRWPSRPAPT
ncbi:LysR family transcriptional regulator [Massilia sp. H-1]|nr:LysR family transcriptional regulator [Massilia sp. H-1]